MDMVQCPDCDKAVIGAVPPRGNKKCSACHGTGRDLGFISSTLDRETKTKTPCSVCSGTRQCQTCGGRGLVVGESDPRPGQPPAPRGDVHGSSSGALGGASQWVKQDSLVLWLYLGSCAAFWALYLSIAALDAAGLIQPETSEGLERSFRAAVKTPLGIALALFFSIGLIMVGVGLLVAIFRLLVPVAIAFGLISVFLKAEQPWPLTVVEVAGVVTALVLYFRWLGRGA